MSIYLERCEVCRDYKPVFLFKEGKSSIRICLRCAYILGKMRVEGSLVAGRATERRDTAISKVIDEISKG